MRSSKTLAAVGATVALLGAAWSADFKADLAAKVDRASKTNTSVIEGADGWLFFVPELRHLSVGTFWGDAAQNVSKATRPQDADPLPTILDFKSQLKKAGIDLLIVPVPAKAAIYPDMIVPGASNSVANRLDASDAEFLDVLKQNGVQVIDLAPAFIRHRKDHPDQNLYSKEDTHWSGFGINIAANLIAAKIKKRAWYASAPHKVFTFHLATVSALGDLVSMSSLAKPGPETVYLTKVWDSKGAPVQSWRQSPVVLLGDSHNLVYSVGGDMFAVSSGLPENLAAKIGFAPDVIGVRGSGATPARMNLARRADNLAGKKMVVWCFSVREFTEGSGWRKVPVIRH